jgi:hypothetical protein
MTGTRTNPNDVSHHLRMELAMDYEEFGSYPQRSGWIPASFMASYPGPLTSRDFVQTEMASLTQIEIMKK